MGLPIAILTKQDMERVVDDLDRAIESIEDGKLPDSESLLLARDVIRQLAHDMTGTFDVHFD